MSSVLPKRYVVSLATSALGPNRSLDELIRMAAGDGFDAVELGLDRDVPLAADAQRYLDCADRIKAAGLSISGLSLESTDSILTESAGVQPQPPAIETVRAALDAALVLRADCLTISLKGLAGPPQGSDRNRLENAYLGALEALRALRFDAQRRAVRLACRFPSEALVISPPEAREFVDQANSPWIGASVDVSDSTHACEACAWIMTLGHRMANVRFTAIRNKASPPSIVAALDRIGYSGPLTFATSIDNASTFLAKGNRLSAN